MTPTEPESKPTKADLLAGTPNPNHHLIRLQSHLAMAALLSMPRIRAGAPSQHTPTPPEERPCVYCGQPKRHNNSYCSPECCKKDRIKNGK